MNMQMMARALLVYRLTGSMASLGAMALANALPMLFLSMFGGVIADRFHKKYVLIIGQSFSTMIEVDPILGTGQGLPQCQTGRVVVDTHCRLGVAGQCDGPHGAVPSINYS